MSRLSDSELERELERRLSAAPLAGTHREEIADAIARRIATVPQQSRLFGFGSRLLAASAAAAALLLMAVVVLRLQEGSFPTAANPSAASTPAPRSVRVATTALPEVTAHPTRPSPAPTTATTSTAPTAAVTRSPSPAAEVGQTIPSSIDGEPVLRPEEAVAQIAAASDATPFLIGGWIAHVQADCFVPDDFPSTPLLAPCGDGDRMDQIRLVLLDEVEGFARQVPIVLRVHAHDALAVECPPDYRDRCERAVVVDEVVWSRSQPRLGEAYPYRLYTHCGLTRTVIEFAGEFWRAQNAQETLSAPAGFGDPFDEGKIRLYGDGRAEYVSSGGVTVLLKETDRPAPFEPCR